MERADYVAQIDASLADPRNLVNRLAPAVGAPAAVEPEVVNERMHKGRPPGATNLSTSMRVLVGVMAHYDKRKNIAEEFDLPENQVTFAKNGKVGGGPGGNGHVVPELRDKVQEGVGKVRETAVDRLVKTLEALTPQRIEDSVGKKPPIATQMAKDLSAVIRNVTPQEQGSGANVSVHIYTPRERTVDEYQSIRIPETPTMK